MNSRVRSILEHMLEDAQDAINFANQAGNINAFSSNKMICKAVVMSILNIGELTKHLPAEYKATYNEIPWKNISGMRDIDDSVENGFIHRGKTARKRLFRAFRVPLGFTVFN